MATLNWFYALLSRHAETESASINGLKSAETRAFENNGQEFMFDCLMDVPFERIDNRRARH